VKRIRVEADGVDPRPVARSRCPPVWQSLSRERIEASASGEDFGIEARMPLSRGDEADGAVSVLVVVPGDEALDPGARGGEAGEARGRVLGAVLEGP
jgi:hypothetical protein